MDVLHPPHTSPPLPPPLRRTSSRLTCSGPKITKLHTHHILGSCGMGRAFQDFWASVWPWLTPPLLPGESVTWMLPHCLKNHRTPDTIHLDPYRCWIYSPVIFETVWQHPSHALPWEQGGYKPRSYACPKILKSSPHPTGPQ